MYKFFFCKLQLITVSFLIHKSYKSLDQRFVSLKACVWFSIFHSVLILLQFSFLFKKACTLWLQTVVTPFTTETVEKLHTLLLPVLWFLCCKKKLLKFNDICVSYGSPKTDPETNILDSEYQSVENIGFAQ